MDDISASRAAKRAKRDALTPSHCEIPGCIWPYQIQRHRIVPGRDGGKYKVGNVIALCPNDHWLADTEFYEPEYLSALVRKRLEENANAKQSNDASTEFGATKDPPSGDHPTEESSEGYGERSSDAGDGVEPRVTE